MLSPYSAAALTLSNCLTLSSLVEASQGKLSASQTTSASSASKRSRRSSILVLTDSEPEDSKQPIKRGRREEKKPKKMEKGGKKLGRVVEEQVVQNAEVKQQLIKDLSQCMVTFSELATATGDVARGKQVRSVDLHWNCLESCSFPFCRPGSQLSKPLRSCGVSLKLPGGVSLCCSNRHCEPLPTARRSR